MSDLSGVEGCLREQSNDDQMAKLRTLLRDDDQPWLPWDGKGDPIDWLQDLLFTLRDDAVMLQSMMSALAKWRASKDTPTSDPSQSYGDGRHVAGYRQGMREAGWQIGNVCRDVAAGRKPT